MLFDLHCDTILKIIGKDTSLYENNHHIDIKKMIKGESLGQFFAMFVDLEKTKTPYETCLMMIERYKKEIGNNKSYINFAYNHSDIITNEISGKISAVLTIEEGGVIEGSLEKLNHFYDLGVRAITLTWNYENEIAYPNAGGKNFEKGLKPFGLEVIKEMNRLGIIIDVSHLSDAGFYDCIKHSTSPIVATHSNARAITNHTRNMTDEMIIALAKKGGVMGMNLCGAFLNDNNESKVSDVVKHIKYIKGIAGVDVIAMGTDYDGIGGKLEMYDISQVHLLKEALVKENFTEEEIDKIFYKNALRVIKEILK